MASEAARIDPDAFDTFEATAWEERVDAYASFFGEITGRLIHPLLDAVEVGPGTRLLDVATGPGYVAGRAAQRGATACGVDIAEAMLVRARAQHEGVEFTRGDAQALPFDDDRFDAVVGNFALPHLSRPEQAVSEAVRVLAPGGRLALTTWDVPARMRMFGAFLEAVGEAGAAPPDGLPPGPDVFRFADDDEFRRLFEAEGLVEVRVSRIEFIHRVERFEDFWEALQRGTVRMASLVLGQPEETRERIRQALVRRVADHASARGLELPVSVKLAAGRTAD
jgi:SAM-dependent methyltransferase